jgi:hypothetical protein
VKKRFALLLLVSLVVTAPGNGWSRLQSVPDFRPLFQQNLRYMSDDFGIQLEGPKDWCGTLQHFDPIQKTPLIGSLPSNTVVYWKKHCGSQSAQIAFNPGFWLKLFVKKEPQTSLSVLKQYISNWPREIMIEEPALVVLGGETWATAEVTYQSEKYIGLELTKKLYVTEHEGLWLVIQSTDFARDHNQNVGEFDSLVSQTVFFPQLTV